MISVPPLIGRDGKQYYVVYVHRYQLRCMHGERAAWRAHDAAYQAGRNWRRIKREMRRARLNALLEYDRENGRS